MGPGQSTYTEAITSINSPNSIMIMDSIAKKNWGSELNRNLRARNSRLVAFPGGTPCWWLHYIVVHRRVQCVVILVGVNDKRLNDSSHNSVENLRKNCQLMIQKWRTYSVREVFWLSILCNTGIKLQLLEEIFATTSLHQWRSNSYR